MLHLVAYAAITLPLLIAGGLEGFAAGSLVVEGVILCGRAYYLSKLFVGFRFLRHALRGFSPVAPAVAFVLVEMLGIEELYLKLAGDMPKEMVFQRELLIARL